MNELCNSCENRRNPNGASVDSLCYSCVHSDSLKVDHFKLKITAQDRLDFILENGLPLKQTNGHYAYEGFVKFQGINEIEVVDKLIRHISMKRLFP